MDPESTPNPDAGGQILARRSCDRTREQLLEIHSVHVASAVRAWCAPLGLAETGRIAGLNHDNGKAPLRWQQEKLYQNKKTQLDHAYVGAWMIDKVAVRTTHERFAVRMAAIAICGHHTGLPDSLTCSGMDGLSAVFAQHDASYVESAKTRLSEENLLPPVDIEAAGAEMERLKRTIEQCTMGEDAPLRHFMRGMSARYLTSCVIDADRTDAMCFEEDRDFPPETRRLDWSSISEKLDVWRAEKRKCADEERAAKREYTRRQDKDTIVRSEKLDRARDAQFAACADVGRRAVNGVYQLAGPTGSGKTAAALRFGIGPMTRGASRLIYVAPYRAIVRQTHETFSEILGGEKDMLLHVGDVARDDPDSAYFAQNWSAPIILTSCVQFLNTLFSGDTRCIRRFHSLAGAVILIDEPQCIPPQLTRHMVFALKTLSRFLGATILLMTATPSLMENCGLDITERIDAIPGELMPAFDRVRAVDMTDFPFTPDGLARNISEADRISTLIVCNTKQTAIDVWRAVKTVMPGGDVFLLTANLCPAQRNVLLDKIKRRLALREDVICVSTQLIQAGVDISFGRGVRALCGLDDIMQTAGRVNRGWEWGRIGEIWIVRIVDEELRSLEEIGKGATVTQNLLRTMRGRQGAFGGNLLSVAALKEYRERYLHEARQLIDDKDYTAHLDEITDNPKGVNTYGRKFRKCPEFGLFQAFRTAGDSFRPLDGAVDSVIVPWGKGVEIIRELGDERLLSARRRQLAIEAQAFAVGVYSNELSRLRAQGCIEERSGMLVAKPEAYDDELGLI